MSNQKHSAGNHHPTSHRGGVFNKKHQWLLIIGVLMMLAGMVVYMATLDEAEEPIDPGSEPVQTNSP